MFPDSHPPAIDVPCMTTTEVSSSGVKEHKPKRELFHYLAHVASPGARGSPPSEGTGLEPGQLGDSPHHILGLNHKHTQWFGL